MDILQWIKDAIDLITSHITADYVALFSVLVTIFIYILNRRAELKFKKYEHQKPEYQKLIDFLSISYTQNEKLQVDKDGKLSKEMQKEFYDMGASLMVFASKKLYREYLFFREFTTSTHIKTCRHYDEGLIIYIVADIMRQIRKEVGLTAFNYLTTNETLGFIINDFATNPVQKNIAQRMNYKIRMLKVELFFMNRYRFVTTYAFFYNFIKPIFGILGCAVKYIVALPVVHFVKKFFSDKS